MNITTNETLYTSNPRHMDERPAGYHVIASRFSDCGGTNGLATGHVWYRSSTDDSSPT